MKPHVTAIAAVWLVSLLNETVSAQQPPPQYPNMSFFITSSSGPKGADFGGIEGADAHCQALATNGYDGARFQVELLGSHHPDNHIF